MPEQLAGPDAGTAGKLKNAAIRSERVKRVSQLGATGKIEALVKVVGGEGTVVGTLFAQEAVLEPIRCSWLTIGLAPRAKSTLKGGSGYLVARSGLAVMCWRAA